MMYKLVKKGEIPSLTGLRFFAAFFVIFVHATVRLTSVPNTMPAWLSSLTPLSAIGMTLFFVLSGYVIHYNYAEKIKHNLKLGTYNFLLARFARLWPLYAFCLTASLLILYFRFSAMPSHFTNVLPVYAVLMQSWLYLPVDGQAMVFHFGTMPAVTWSISTEWFFYFVYPLICFLLLRKSTFKKKLIHSLLFCVAGYGLVYLITVFQLQINGLAVSHFGSIASYKISYENSFIQWLVYHSPYSRIFEFILGCMTASICIDTGLEQPSQAEEYAGFILTIMALILFVLMFYFVSHPPTWDKSGFLFNLQQCFGFAPIFAILIFCCARYANPIIGLLSHPYLVFGGEISYSIYLLHQIIIGLVFHLTDKIPGYSVVKLFILLIMTGLVSILTYCFIEIPSRLLIRNKFTLSDKNSNNNADLAHIIN